MKNHKQLIVCSECPRSFRKKYHNQKTCSDKCSLKREKRVSKLYRERVKFLEGI